jgi:hypothetical protein
VSVLAAAALLPGSLASPAAAMPAVEPSGTWGPPRQVITFADYSPPLAWSQAGTVVHALSGGVNQGYYYQRTSDDGATWRDRVQVAGTRVFTSRLVAADGRVYVVSSRYGAGGEWLVMRRNGADGAAGSWSAPKALTAPREDGGPFDAAASGSSVHVVTTLVAPGPSTRIWSRAGGRVVVLSSRDHGATWSTRTLARLDRRAPQSSPLVAASGRHVVVAWKAKAGRTAVRARISHDSGRTWGPTTALGAGTKISVAALGSRLAVASGIRGGGAWVREHRDGSWRKARVVPIGASTQRKRPVVALHGSHEVGVLVGRYPADGSGLVLQWYESADRGVSWAPPVTIARSFGGQVLWLPTGELTIETYYPYYLRTRT